MYKNTIYVFSLNTKINFTIVFDIKTNEVFESSI